MGAEPAAVEATRRRRRRRNFATALVALGAISTILVAGLGWVPLHGPSRTTVGPGRVGGPDVRNASFLDDLPLATAFAANRSGGPWTLVGGKGFETPSRVSVPLEGSGASPCPLVPEPYSARSTVGFPPAFVVDGGGLTPAWSYDFLGPAGHGLRVEVLDGTAIELGRLVFQGAGCPAAERPTQSANGSIDSRSIALAALHDGGQEFLSEYPASTVTYTLAPGPEPGKPAPEMEWNVTYSSCRGVNAAGTASIGDRLTLRYDAPSGTLEVDAPATFGCPLGDRAPLPYELGDGLALNDPVLAYAGNQAFYNASIALVCCGLTFANLTVGFHGNASLLLSAATLVVTNASGGLLCTLGSTELEGATPTGCAAAVAEGELLSVRLPAQGSTPGNLTFEGVWDFAGSVDLPLDLATLLAPDGEPAT